MRLFGRSYFLLLPLFLFLNSSILAQKQVGERMPDLKFNELINYKSPSFRLADFRGKLIIFDFWSISCASCIEAFPKLESLQKTFSDKIQILLVNHEDKKQTIEFFEKRKKMFRQPDLIFITGDTILAKMFPKDYVPWEVWIDSEQRFRFVTDGNDVTEGKISNFINKGEFMGAVLTPHPDFKRYKPLFEQTNKEYLKAIQFYSYIAKHEEGLDIGGSGFYLYQPGKMRLVRGAANSVEELFVTAFSEDYSLHDFVRNNVSLEVFDTVKFRRPENNAEQYEISIKNFSYIYDCVLPESNATRAYEIMRQDLVNFFNVNVSVEKRRTKSLVLVRMDNKDRLLSKGINKKLAMDSLYTRYNYPFRDFVSDMKNLFRIHSVPYSLIDETGYTENIDILNINTWPFRKRDKDMSAFRSELQKYGLDLIEKEYLQDVLVIKDKN